MKRCPLCGKILAEIAIDSRRVIIRGICPEDRDKLLDFYNKLSDETIYTRFFSIIRYFDPYVERLVSKSGILGVVAEDVETGEIVGVAELILEKNGVAEGGIVILESMQGRGLGSTIARVMRDIARSFGIKRVYGYILADNVKALKLVKKLGGRLKEYYSSMILVEIPLDGD